MILIRYLDSSGVARCSASISSGRFWEGPRASASAVYSAATSASASVGVGATWPSSAISAAAPASPMRVDSSPNAAGVLPLIAQMASRTTAQPTFSTR